MDLSNAVRLLGWVWLLLAVGAALAPLLGRDLAVLGSFGCACLAACRARTRVRGPSVSALRLAAAALLGLLLHPGLCLWILPLGLALGLAAPVATGSSSEGAGMVLATLVLAPVFEEVLYREQLIPALVPRLGHAGAVATASVLFSLPHLEPWAMLGTFVAGLLLGAAWLVHTDLGVCVGLHAGLNAAALLAGHLAAGLPT